MTSFIPGSTDSGAHASTSELQKDFSHSREHRFRCACVNFWASERFLPLKAEQIQVHMRQLLSFRRTSPKSDSREYLQIQVDMRQLVSSSRRTSPSTGSTERGASSCELQKDFSNSRNNSFKNACSEVLAVYLTSIRNRNQEKAAKLSRNLGPPTSVLHIANIPEGLGHHDIKVSCIWESARVSQILKKSLWYRARKRNDFEWRRDFCN